MRGIAAIVALAGLGLWLIWKGVTGDVMYDRFGQAMIPRWAYIVAGLVLLVLPLLALFVFSERHRAMFGFI
jgi:hypothetical protein